MVKHFNIRAFGKVKGVDFRESAKEQADTFGIAGFVKNETGSSVYIEAEGEEEALRKFVEWCKSGTAWSKVEKVETSEGEMQNFKEFTVIRSFLS